MEAFSEVLRGEAFVGAEGFLGLGVEGLESSVRFGVEAEVLRVLSSAILTLALTGSVSVDVFVAATSPIVSFVSSTCGESVVPFDQKAHP